MANHGDRDASAHTSPAAAVLYRRLLALHTHDDPEPMLDDAIRLIVEVTGAQLAIIELFGGDGQTKFWRGYGPMTELDDVRKAISRGIIRHTTGAKETVLTPSAIADPRFASLESVKQRDIQAVLSSRIGDGIGVIYVQGRSEPGSFSEQDCDLLQLLPRHKGNIASLARELGVSRQHVYDQIDELKLRR